MVSEIQLPVKKNATTPPIKPMLTKIRIIKKFIRSKSIPHIVEKINLAMLGITITYKAICDADREAPNLGLAKNSTRNGKSIKLPKPMIIQLISVVRNSLFSFIAFMPMERALDLFSEIVVFG